MASQAGIRRHRQPLPIPARTQHYRHRGLHRDETARRGRRHRCSCGFSYTLGTGIGSGPAVPDPGAVSVAAKHSCGLSAAAAGLLIATGIRLLLPHRTRPAAIGFAVLAFGLVTFGKLPLLIVLFGLVPISIAVAAVQTARAR